MCGRHHAPRLRKTTVILAVSAAWVCGSLSSYVRAEPLKLQLRSQSEVAAQTGRYHTRVKPTEWAAEKTAIVVCDMWDKHWCPQSTERVAEMAPRMNQVLTAARQRGVLIIHCPSDTMDYYKDHPGRTLAMSAPAAMTSRPLERWCRLDPTREPTLPIDDSDGGCDCAEPVQNYRAWSKQIDTLEIVDGDAITDSAEAYNLMRARGIEHVIVMGVHTNMCVLGRPFSIRQLVYQGLDVALMRDMTDTMYNPQKAPYVSHFSGTDLVIDHIERHWCPTLISGDFLDGKEFRFAADRRPHVVIVSAEDEYKTEETLTRFAAEHLRKDYRVSFVFETPGQKYQLPGLDVLKEADLLLLSVRRRPLPAEQLEQFRTYLAAGKPLVGIRTANHAFCLRNQPPPEGTVDWPEFDREIIGGNYSNHHGNELKAWVWTTEGQSAHPMLQGMPTGEQPIEGSLYVVSPLAPTTTELLRGRVEGIEQTEPVAWLNRRADGGITFYTSLGHRQNFELPWFNQLLKNAIAECLKHPLKATNAAAVESTDSAPVAAVSTPLEQTAAVTQTETPSTTTDDWQTLQVPGTWDSQRPQWAQRDGFAWYRTQVHVPAEWKGAGLYLYVEKVDNACETYFNGVKVGVSGTFPPNYTSGLTTNEHRYVVPASLVRADGVNTVAIRVYDHDGAGGFKGRAPSLIHGNQAITLTGPWQFRWGDDAAWATAAFDVPQLFRDVGPAPELSRFATVINRTPQDHPLSPEESRQRFKVPDDLEVELVLSEPVVAQPLFLNFDDRGRMWVLQYLQYPEPAGLTLLSKDQWWRAVYDKVPLPPPLGDRGADKITIHTDTDGDGQFDQHQVFVDGLNIATSFAQSHDGVYVLNPPYLLFYPDKNRDDVPDADPEVLLSGFGLEDTHSVANSLRWGPDGWLYGAQGSTVSAAVVRPGEKTPIRSQGQNIWRYHPVSRKYEIFAEGGGNAFNVEIDAQGRIFSGHNGGNTRGFHYFQGAYLQKGFSKHGPLSNPYSFGYFPAMDHGDYARFTHNFVIYEGHGLPERYAGRLFGVNPIMRHVVVSERIPVGSTFRTKDEAFAIESADDWFRPVDIKDGPDGWLYVADWYDGQLGHTANYQGGMDRDRGRIWRIRSKTGPAAVPDSELTKGLRHASDDTLLERLRSPHRWHRQMARQLLAERASPALSERLWHTFFLTDSAPSQPVTSENAVASARLDLFWAAAAGGALPAARYRDFIEHHDPQIRLWTIRLLADGGALPSDVIPLVAERAARDPDLQVLCQIAASAKRLPAEQALPVVQQLLQRDDFATDARFPLMVWWALEQQVLPAREAVITMWTNPALWQPVLARQEILPRLMRRFAATGQRADLAVCASLLRQSPGPETTQALMRGFEEAYQGRLLANVPPELVAALAAAGGGSLSLKVRQGDAKALSDALALLANEQTSPSQRSELARLFGEVSAPEAVPVLLDVFQKTNDDSLKVAVLGALPKATDERIADVLLAQFPQLTADVRVPALSVLSSRLTWSKALVAAVQRGDLRASDIPDEIVRQLTIHRDDRLAAAIKQLWGDVAGASTAEMQQQLEQALAVLSSADGGNPYPGKQLYNQHCAKCHTLHAQGGQIGPDLTTFKRDDVRTLLTNIINPSAEIREGFETLVAITTDGRIVQGFLVEQDPTVLVLRAADGQTVSLERAGIEELIPQKKSLMPENLLKSLSDSDLRHLFAYLRSTQPLND
jgi:putative membrane-bound dehydrogenase-like protein